MEHAAIRGLTSSDTGAQHRAPAVDGVNARPQVFGARLGMRTTD